MQQTDIHKRVGIRWLLCLLALLGFAGTVAAQSGPYGNEWIVPGQQYYKIKITRDGLYKLDYQYLTQTGFSNGIDPARLQLWRRGREVAVYQGGTRNVFDANTYLEFYGQRNDGRLDRDLYKNATDQPHQYYSFYTDTAAYFLTYGPALPLGKRMVESLSAGGGTPHAWRLYTGLVVENWAYVNNAHDDGHTFLPWLEPGEGFFSGNLTGAGENIDSLRAILPTSPAPAPRVEIGFLGGTLVGHRTETLVTDPVSSANRSLGFATYSDYNGTLVRYGLRRSDISGAAGGGRLHFQFAGSGTGSGSTADVFRVTYIKVVVPQANRWFARSRQLFFQNDSLLSGPATFEVDSIPAAVRGYDITDPWAVQRITPATAQTLGALGRRFVFPSATAAQTRRLMLAGIAPYVPAAARPVRFRVINPATANFIIVTHPQLFRSAGDPATFNAPRAYAAYRASAVGGRYDTLVVTAPQLYDQFHYGERSWLALRHFGLWMAAGAPSNTNRYLLLLGKGVMAEEPLIGGSNFANTFTTTVTRALGERGVDLVPCSSRAVSDNMLTADFRNNNFVPRLHTGRLTAVNSQQVMSYLAKLMQHDTLGLAPWRKNVLHLVGGKEPNETADFLDIMSRAKARAERPLFGGTVATQVTNTPDGLPVTVNIAAELNAGLSLISYFGHGSNNKFQLDFGAPSDPNAGYVNTGKYPFLFLNGCAGNKTFVGTYTRVEDWLFTPNKGAIGSLGESEFSYADLLDVSQDTLYRLLFNDPAWYGKPVTVVHDEVVRRLQGLNLYSDGRGIEQLLTAGWQGDPTLALYAPSKPDFIARATSLSVTPGPGQTTVRAASTSFNLNVGVANPGQITRDPVEIRVTRTYQSSSRPPLVYSLFTKRQAIRPDTTYVLTLSNTPAEGGLSTFKVELDPNQRVVELNENNNIAQVDFTFLQGGLTLLNPTNFAISTVAQPRLVAQNNDPRATTRDYDFEIDTVATFNGMVQRTTRTAALLVDWQPTLPVLAGRDSVVWYWRARFHTAATGEDGNWFNASFRVIPTSPGGWSQSHYAQLQQTTRTGVAVSAPTGHWTFTDSRVPLTLRTRGGGAPRTAPAFGSLTGAGIILQSTGALPSVSGCGILSPNLLVAVYDPTTLRPVVVPGTYQRCGQGNNQFYYFSVSDPIPASAPDSLDNLNYSAVRRQELNNFLTAIPVGSYVALVSANRLRYSLLPAALKNRIRDLVGSQLINQLADSEPLALVGQKLSATTGRLLHEKGPDATSATLPINQSVTLNDTLHMPGVAGKVVSPRIGPAKEWLNLYSTIRKLSPISSRDTLRVVAIDTLGAETVFFPNVARSVQSLATLAATRYPYLRLELTLRDTVTRVPSQLRQWLVTYRPLPEGVVRRDLVAAANYDPATLLQQATAPAATISFPVQFQNVTDVPFASTLQTRVNLRDTGNNNRVVATALLTAPGPLAAGATISLPVTLSVAGLFGTFATEVVVNPRLQPEQLYSNNELTLDPFTVIDRNVPPVLDVAFDGRHILNGELVSPSPIITMQLNDEDKTRHITNASFFTVTLQRPGQSAATAVDVSGSDVIFSVDNTNGSVAKLEYHPGKTTPLADGVYTLRVQGRDPSNASAGSQAFEVKFEVVNASTITNVYPYPNPVVSKARFVFTVTGQELPRNMKIQIMTLTGRVVREIFMSELGPLHIGNNLTDFAWDGTDSYGDRLANGTYLYRVSLDDASGTFSQRATAGDKAFKNDWGKLVLLR